MVQYRVSTSTTTRTIRLVHSKVTLRSCRSDRTLERKAIGIISTPGLISGLLIPRILISITFDIINIKSNSLGIDSNHNMEILSLANIISKRKRIYKIILTCKWGSDNCNLRTVMLWRQTLLTETCGTYSIILNGITITSIMYSRVTFLCYLLFTTLHNVQGGVLLREKRRQRSREGQRVLSIPCRIA